ncbi:MAG: hypothetical protein ACP5N2_07260 [Candidatus Nanoarchaeia archaeon]
MTRLKIVLIVIAALMLSAAAFFYASQIGYFESIDKYAVRKEEILLTQQRLETDIYFLNESIQMELDNQKLLTEKVTELSVKADVPPPIINTTKTVQAAPVIVTVPKPKPVTRAS